MNVTTIGVDLAKNVFSVHGVDLDAAAVADEHDAYFLYCAATPPVRC